MDESYSDTPCYIVIKRLKSFDKTKGVFPVLKNILLTFVTSSLIYLLLSSCQQGTIDVTSQDPKNQKNEQTEHKENVNSVNDNNAHQLDTLSTLLALSKENEQLNHSIDIFVKEWSQENKFKNFTVTDKHQENVEYSGQFLSYNEWNLKGQSINDQEFSLIVENDNITLKMGEHEEQLLDESSFVYLTPLKHIEHIQSLLEETSYDYLEWTHKADSFNVLIETNGSILKEEFFDFIFAEDQQMTYNLNQYTLRYLLSFQPSDDEMVISNLTFSLKRSLDVEELEHLYFSF